MLELSVGTDVVGFVVKLAGQHQQHTIGAEVVHFAPDQVTNQQALGG